MASTILHEKLLKDKYSCTCTVIRSSTQITKRVAALLTLFGIERTIEKSSKPVVVVLQASARAANKLVSIVEIAKRELKAQNQAVFQYTALSSEMVAFRPKGRGMPSQQQQDDANNDSDDAFEPLGIAVPSQPVEERAAPLLTIYLSSTTIKELRTAYGEQKD